MCSAIFALLQIIIVMLKYLMCRVLEGLLIFIIFIQKGRKGQRENALKREQNHLDNQYLKQRLHFAHVERMHQAFLKRL